MDRSVPNPLRSLPKDAPSGIFPKCRLHDEDCIWLPDKVSYQPSNRHPELVRLSALPHDQSRSYQDLHPFPPKPRELFLSRVPYQKDEGCESKPTDHASSPFQHEPAKIRFHWELIYVSPSPLPPNRLVCLKIRASAEGLHPLTLCFQLLSD